MNSEMGDDDGDSVGKQAAALAGQLFNNQNTTPPLSDIPKNDMQDHIFNVEYNYEASMEEDDEIKNALADIEDADEVAPAVSGILAEAYNKTLTRPLSKDNNEKIRNQLRIPENCATFRVPKMNSEIWNRLPQKARMNDLKYQQLQQTLSLGLTVLVKLSDELSQNSQKIPKEVLTKVLKIGLDGANLMGNQMQDLNTKRKLEVKQYINAEFSDICTAKIPVSEFLFGSNLTESLKITKATSSVIKNTIGGNKRFRPYPVPNQPHLNFQRPFMANRGWMNGRPQQFNNRGNHRFPSQGRPRFPNPTHHGHNANNNLQFTQHQNFQRK